MASADVEKGTVSFSPSTAVSLSPNPPPAYTTSVGSANVEDFKQQSVRRKSLKVQLQETKAESKGPLNFVLGCCCIVTGSVACTALLGILIAIPVATIAIGSVYLHDCPRQHYIPIYLIVAGCFSAANIVSKVIRGAFFKQSEEEEKKVDVKRNLFEAIVGIFLFCWFIAGSVWIYGCYHDVELRDSTNLEKYCHPVLYYYAFCITTLSYGLLALSCCCVCLAGCFSSLCKD